MQVKLFGRPRPQKRDHSRWWWLQVTDKWPASFKLQKRGSIAYQANDYNTHTHTHKQPRFGANLKSNSTLSGQRVNFFFFHCIVYRGCLCVFFGHIFARHDWKLLIIVSHHAFELWAFCNAIWLTPTMAMATELSSAIRWKKDAARNPKSGLFSRLKIANSGPVVVVVVICSKQSSSMQFQKISNCI